MLVDIDLGDVVVMQILQTIHDDDEVFPVRRWDEVEGAREQTLERFRGQRRRRLFLQGAGQDAAASQEGSL